MPLDYYVHPSSVIDEGVQIGDGTKIWHFSHIQKNTRVGRNCSFGQNVYVANNVCIGDGVKIQNNVSIFEGVELEDFVFCGPSVVFTNVLFPRSEYSSNKNYVKTKVSTGATIGANSTIICGIFIGKYALVGAGSVVTKSVPNYALVVGNPAKQIGWVCKCGSKIIFSNEKAICEKCFKGYLLNKRRDEIFEI